MPGNTTKGGKSIELHDAFNTIPRAVVLSGGLYAVDLAVANDFDVTITGNGALTFSNAANGRKGKITATQSGGPYTWTTPATIYRKIGGSLALNATGRTCFVYWCDGTDITMVRVADVAYELNT